jgi:hypothetical protein
LKVLVFLTGEAQIDDLGVRVLVHARPIKRSSGGGTAELRGLYHVGRTLERERAVL